MRYATLALALLTAPVSITEAQTGARNADRAAVEAAALDYVEALYSADPSRIERSVHPQLTKRGFWRDNATAPWGPQLTMTYDQLLALTKKWNADKKRDTSIKTTARRPNADSYWRCEQCGEVWNVGRRTSRAGGGHIIWR